LIISGGVADFGYPFPICLLIKQKKEW